jgi:hypothetical protein
MADVIAQLVFDSSELFGTTEEARLELKKTGLLRHSLSQWEPTQYFYPNGDPIRTRCKTWWDNTTAFLIGISAGYLMITMIISMNPALGELGGPFYVTHTHCADGLELVQARPRQSDEIFSMAQSGRFVGCNTLWMYNNMVDDIDGCPAGILQCGPVQSPMHSCLNTTWSLTASHPTGPPEAAKLEKGQPTPTYLSLVIQAVAATIIINIKIRLNDQRTSDAQQLSDDINEIIKAEGVPEISTMSFDAFKERFHASIARAANMSAVRGTWSRKSKFGAFVGGAFGFVVLLVITITTGGTVSPNTPAAGGGSPPAHDVLLFVFGFFVKPLVVIILGAVAGTMLGGVVGGLFGGERTFALPKKTCIGVCNCMFVVACDCGVCFKCCGACFGRCCGCCRSQRLKRGKLRSEWDPDGCEQQVWSEMQQGDAVSGFAFEQRLAQLFKAAEKGDPIKIQRATSSCLGAATACCGKTLSTFFYSIAVFVPVALGAYSFSYFFSAFNSMDLIFVDLYRSMGQNFTVGPNGDVIRGDPLFLPPLYKFPTSNCSGAGILGPADGFPAGIPKWMCDGVLSTLLQLVSWGIQASWKYSIHPSDFWLGNAQVLAIAWAEGLATIIIIYLSKVYFVEFCCMRKRGKGALLQNPAGSYFPPTQEGEAGWSRQDPTDTPTTHCLVSSYSEGDAGLGEQDMTRDPRSSKNEALLDAAEGIRDDVDSGRRMWLLAHERVAKGLFLAGMFLPPFGWYVVVVFLGRG